MFWTLHPTLVALFLEPSGIGFILAFNKPPLALAIAIHAILALFYAGRQEKCA
jgi:hypothetical protein